MSDELNPTADTGSVPAETGSVAESPAAIEPQSTDPSTQVDDKLKSVNPPATVEPGASNSSAQSRPKPSAFYEIRHENRQLKKRLGSLEESMKKMSESPPRQGGQEIDPSVIFQNDDEFIKPGVANSLNKFYARIMEDVKKGLPNFWTEHQQMTERDKEAQEVEKRIDEIIDSPNRQRYLEVLQKDTRLNEISKVDPKWVLDFIDKEYLSKPEKKSPLAPPKSRMGLNGSGNPVGGGNGTPSIEQIREMKAKWEEQVPTRVNDPEFQKEGDKIRELYDRLNKK